MSKLTDDEITTMEKLTAKAQIPKLAPPTDPNIVDLTGDEYEEKVDHLLQEVDDAAVAEK